MTQSVAGRKGKFTSQQESCHRRHVSLESVIHMTDSFKGGAEWTLKWMS